MEEPTQGRKDKHEAILIEMDNLFLAVRELTSFVNRMEGGGNSETEKQPKDPNPSLVCTLNILPKLIIKARKGVDQAITRLKELLF